MFIVSKSGEEDVELWAKNYTVDDDGTLIFWGPRKREVGRVKDGEWDKVFLVADDKASEPEIVVEAEDAE